MCCSSGAPAKRQPVSVAIDQARELLFLGNVDAAIDHRQSQRFAEPPRESMPFRVPGIGGNQPEAEFSPEAMEELKAKGYVDADGNF